MWCSCVAHARVCSGPHRVKTFHMGCCRWAVCRADRTNKIFFFLCCHEIESVVPSRRIKSRNLDIVIMCYKFFFTIYFFFYTMIASSPSSCRLIFFFFFFFMCPSSVSMIIHHRNNFFFIIIALAAVCCYATLVVLWDCYDLMCRFASLCAVMKLHIKKILTDFLWYPHALRCARARLLSWVPRVGRVTHVMYAAHVSENASHIATLALDVSFPCSGDFF
jgi:hypothetical protein